MLVMTGRCTGCGHRKFAVDFHARSEAPSGHRSQCKSCENEARRKRHKANPRKVYFAKYKKKNRKKRAAQSAVYRAIKAGRLKKCPCEACGTRRNVEAHHDSYDRPLDVRWYCKKCHSWYHRHGHFSNVA